MPTIISWAHTLPDLRAWLSEGIPEKVISKVIHDDKMELLVMGAYGHSRIRQLIIGSTTTTLIRTSRIPVLMFR